MVTFNHMEVTLHTHWLFICQLFQKKKDIQVVKDEMDVESEVITGGTRLQLADCDQARLPATVRPWDAETMRQAIKDMDGCYYAKKKHISSLTSKRSGQQIKAIHNVTLR